MPERSKKPTKKSTTPKRPSSDPNRRAHQLMAEMAAKQASGPAPAIPDAVREYMSSLGKKGGPRGGKARAEALSGRKRTEIAKKAAAARWKK